MADFKYGYRLLVIYNLLFREKIRRFPGGSGMDAIRKKMQSLKGETDSLYKTIAGFEEATREAVGRAEQVSLILFSQKVYFFTTLSFSRLTVTSATMARKSSSWRLVLTKRTTS